MARKTKELEEKQVKTTKKTSSSTKKSTSSSKKDVTKKLTKTKKTVAKKKSTKVVSVKSTKAKASKSSKNIVEFKSEYYDLPFMYDKTVVKILAQTPKMLFIYWEISEKDRRKLKDTYGENFFNTTRPILIVYNDTLHYSFEVNIDDFANSWYLHIDDSNCNYHVELGRRPYPDDYQNNFSGETNNPSTYIPYYIYVSSSNEMASPNNKILFDPNIKSVKFRNVKTGKSFEKDINQFTFITNFGIFSIHDLYKFLYPNEDFSYENIVIGNTSSGALSSSGMFSSQFK